MTKQTIENRLREVAQHIKDMAPTHLAEVVKTQIPNPLPHVKERGTISIIVHLRISRLTAIAAIITTLIACTVIFSERDFQGGDLYGDLKALVEFLPGNNRDRASMLRGFEHYCQKLVKDGYETAYFGEVADPKNPEDLLMYWRLEDGNYRVVFADFRNIATSPETLIWLQGRMLRNRTEK
ncbi:hypothetical protein ACFL6U_27815 [Planctomycetota bacterium]